MANQNTVKYNKKQILFDSVYKYGLRTYILKINSSEVVSITRLHNSVWDFMTRVHKFLGPTGEFAGYGQLVTPLLTAVI